MSSEQNPGGSENQQSEEYRQDEPKQKTSIEQEARSYYEQFLRKEHPEYDDATVSQKVEQAMSDEVFRNLIRLKMQFDKEVREKHPDWDLGDL
jgi:ubiquinone biosynthesis protein Coq4